MPEHAAIKLDQPGKCPICGMTLDSRRRKSSRPRKTSTGCSRDHRFFAAEQVHRSARTIALVLRWDFRAAEHPARRDSRSLGRAGDHLHRVAGQAPQIVQDQVTYPITTKMLSVPAQGGSWLFVLRVLVRLCHFRGRHRSLLGAQPRSRIPQRLGASCPKASRHHSGPMRRASAGRSCIRSIRRTAISPNSAPCRIGI